MAGARGHTCHPGGSSLSLSRRGPGRGPCPGDAFHLPGSRPVLRFPPAAAAGALLSPEGALSGCREGPRERGPGWWSQLCRPFLFRLHGGGARLCLSQRIGGRGSQHLLNSLIIQLLLLNGLKILGLELGVIIITFSFCFLFVLLCFYPSKAWLNFTHSVALAPELWST